MGSSRLHLVDQDDKPVKPEIHIAVEEGFPMELR